MWPLAKVSHLWGLSPNLLHLPTVSKIPPCTPASLQIKPLSFGPKSHFTFTKSHLLPNVFPWISFLRTSSQTLGFPCPNSCHVYNTKYTHFCHFPYSSHLYFSGFTLSFLLHFPCNSLHVTYRHFQMTKRVYHVPISCISPIYIKWAKYHIHGIHPLFLLIIMPLCSQYSFQYPQFIISILINQFNNFGLTRHIRHPLVIDSISQVEHIQHNSHLSPSIIEFIILLTNTQFINLGYLGILGMSRPEF